MMENIITQSRAMILFQGYFERVRRGRQSQIWRKLDFWQLSLYDVCLLYSVSKIIKLSLEHQKNRLVVLATES